MRIGIVSNIEAAIGLARDFELLAEYLRELGHEVTGIQFDGVAPDNPFDLAIYLEVVPRNMLNISDRRFLFANPEWIRRDAVDLVNKLFEKVFAKTREGRRVLDKLFPGKVHYTGFMARDRYMPEFERQPSFLHVGGNSSLRGTQAVVDAWRWTQGERRIDAQLFVVSRALKDRPPLPNVTYFDIVEDDELLRLQNGCAFHLYPSGTEGFGHAIHEALSTGNNLIVTGEPPMDEILTALHIPSCGKTSYGFATVYEVSALDIFRTCRDVLDLWRKHDVKTLWNGGRQEFVEERESFKKLFRRHLDEAPIDRDAPAIVGASTRPFKEIAFLGNFQTEESTENMVKWALEDLGHTVLPIQENQVASIKFLEQFTKSADLFVWIHTHTWLKLPDEMILEFFQSIEKRGVRTLSMHLDKFWGIPEREKRIGVDPFWKTQYVYTADGGFQKEFGERGVRHFWLKPAVSKVYCHPGVKREEFACDVGFVGARDYHKEYPFRKELVDFLEHEYSGRFLHVQGVRGHRLNDFYASCKVAVGDCIFAGTKKYWSDRVPETCGRGGFLLHPDVPGLMIPTPVYNPQDLTSLEEELEKWLANDADRAYIRGEATKYTIERDTWTTRMREILATIYD